MQKFLSQYKNLTSNFKLNKLTHLQFNKFSHISFSSKFRVEKDSFGDMNVPADRYWAAQTQRSLQNFEIGTQEDKMPISVVHAMSIVKKSAAKVSIKHPSALPCNNNYLTSLI